MSDGFIIVYFNKLIDFLQKLNLIEHLKKCVQCKFSDNTIESKKRIANLVIDCFITFKWLLMVVLIGLNISNILINIIVFYLLFSNIHTYFYYHVWSARVIKGERRTLQNIRRRFISLMQSLGYVIVTYIYFYYVSFDHYFKFSDKYSKLMSSIYHSFSSVFIGGTDYVVANSNIGLIIQGSQTLITFIFIGIILSKSE